MSVSPRVLRVIAAIDKFDARDMKDFLSLYELSADPPKESGYMMQAEPEAEKAEVAASGVVWGDKKTTPDMSGGKKAPSAATGASGAKT